jgi:hypothetical protein
LLHFLPRRVPLLDCFQQRLSQFLDPSLRQASEHSNFRCLFTAPADNFPSLPPLHILIFPLSIICLHFQILYFPPERLYPLSYPRFDITRLLDQLRPSLPRRQRRLLPLCLLLLMFLPHRRTPILALHASSPSPLITPIAAHLPIANPIIDERERDVSRHVAFVLAVEPRE